MRRANHLLASFFLAVPLLFTGCTSPTGPDAHVDLTGGHPQALAAWDDLMAGNRRFVDDQAQQRELIHTRAALVSGQQPEAIVLACSDSRVGPEIIFDKNLGDIFVVRTAGNVADPVALGSIEYAVEHLHCHLLVVIGHDSCGAVNAAIAAKQSGQKMPTENLQAIVDKIEPALTNLPSGADPVAANVRQSAADLQSNSALVAEHVASGDLVIVRALYHLDSGKVERLSD